MPKKKKRKQMGNPSHIDNYLGPWASYEGETIGELHGATEEELKAYEESKEANGSKEKKAKTDDGSKETINFHGKSLYDYQSRTYMNVPQNIGINLNGEPGRKECFIPEKLIHIIVK